MRDSEYIEGGYMDQLVFRKAQSFVLIPEFPADPELRQPDDVVCNVSHTVRENLLASSRSIGLQNSIELVTIPESIDNLMTGTANLINTVIENYHQARPVDTLLFLDKSARNGAYLFRLMWRELQQRGELPVDMTQPDIRFMNVGRHDDDKHDSPAALELLRAKFQSQDFQDKRVILVDEFVASAGSMRMGLKTIEDLYGTVPSGIALFEKMPLWYGAKDLGLLGVTDLEDHPGRFSKVKESLHQIQPAQARFLLELTSKMSQSEFIEAVSQVGWAVYKQGNLEEAYQVLQQNPDNVLQLSDLEGLSQIILGARLASVDGEHIWEYVDTAGGFLASRLQTPEQSENSRYYRRVLQAIVTEFMLERDKQNQASANHPF